MSKRRRHQGGNHERWLVSYADFITLLFAFFVVMFASSEVNRKKVAQMAQTYSAYLEGGAQAAQSVTAQFEAAEREAAEREVNPQTAKELALEAVEAQMHPIQESIEDSLKELIEAQKLSVSLEARGLVVSLKEAAVFGAGEAAFRVGASEVLDRVAKALGGLDDYEIRLEGHTDDVPIRSSRFPSNWELSSARAIEVMQFMARYPNLDESRMSVAGYGENRPIGENTTDAGRATNRRVDIVILSAAAALAEPERRQE
ncbi:MAG: OmpA family protein [Acidobacteria bacterium]|nr:OmpA family protein [Acidobacteriota bacterium]